VALFFRVKKEPEAIDLANTGMVFINRPTSTTADLPFGGIKNSGYGRELSSLGIHEFINKKLVRLSEIDDSA
jgi:succinate-semialdehyde dehydrogenase / glutarate-semialdehyde dehydrogenase